MGVAGKVALFETEQDERRKPEDWHPLGFTTGVGYAVSIYGFYGEYEADGWAAGAYDDLHGIAIEPDPEPPERSAWLRVVRCRLTEQGIIFMPREKVQEYLDTEGSTGSRNEAARIAGTRPGRPHLESGCFGS